MAEGPDRSARDSDFGALIAGSPELWQLADEFAHSLPVHTTLLLDALRHGSAEELRRIAAQLKTRRKPPTELILRFARFGTELEQDVIGDLGARMDELTATILKIQVQLQKHMD